MNKTNFYFTVDFDWIPGSEKCVRALFDLVEKYEVKPTIFFTGKFAENYSDIVQESVKNGYLIGNHGFAHGKDPYENYGSSVSSEIQRKLLFDSTEIIEKISGIRTDIFRAPRMNISKKTFLILDELKYKKDSSIASGRFDFGLRSINSFTNFFSPQKPYYIKEKNMKNRILEIPPSALFLPLNMRLLRTLDFWFIAHFLSIIEKRTNHIVFYLHPTEFVNAKNLQIPKGENLNFFKTCTPKNFELLNTFLRLIRERNYQFKYM